MVWIFFLLVTVAVVLGNCDDIAISGDKQAGGIHEYSVFAVADFCSVFKLGCMVAKSLNKVY